MKYSNCTQTQLTKFVNFQASGKTIGLKQPQMHKRLLKCRFPIPQFSIFYYVMMMEKSTKSTIK